MAEKTLDVASLEELLFAGFVARDNLSRAERAQLDEAFEQTTVESREELYDLALAGAHVVASRLDAADIYPDPDGGPPYVTIGGVCKAMACNPLRGCWMS